MTPALLTLLLVAASITIGILVLIFVLVPLFQGIGSGIGHTFRGIGWFIVHLAEYIGGTFTDLIRLLGTIPALVALGLLATMNVVIGRWSAAVHFVESFKRELAVGIACLYRAVLRRPLKLFWLHGLLEGIEQRLPQAIEDAPGRDTPSRRTGQFDGYEIVGSLRAGGSGSKLYIARPLPEKIAAFPEIPERVVIKSFAMTDGSSLPQIIRESRALEAAKQLGLVIEHGMTDARFHYVMPYIPGEHLGVLARDLHGRSPAEGLGRRELDETLHYLSDLLATLSAYHQAGLWHKDVKPDNVIIHDGRAHLVDLGLVTPLRSAMTLTTHGTEYFRDPEMVRQALRGVKVHQVDGAKFDIYAVGAVLYFMIENTFPAHGGLSSFTKKSPEAIRWIVRRAMAEYNKRYETAEMMLADLHAVCAAADPFQVKPVDLPSMHGGDAAQAGDRVQAVPPPPPGPSAAPPRVAAAVPPAAKQNVQELVRQRPKLRVTNWLTGAYTVEDDGGHQRMARGIPQRPAARVRPSAPRRAAVQLQSARQRVAVRRAAVAKSRHLRAPAERRPGPMMIFLGICVIGGIFLITLSMSRTNTSSPQAVVNTQILSALNDPIRLGGYDSGHGVVLPSRMASPTMHRLFIVNDDPDTGGGLRTEQGMTLLRHFGGAGLHVTDRTREDEVRSHLQTLSRAEADTPDAVLALNEILGHYGCDAVIWFPAKDHELAGTPVSFVRLDADQHITGEHEGRLALINDHPRAINRDIAARIEAIVQQHRMMGYTVVELDDYELEARLRLALEALATRLTDDVTDSFQLLLQESELHGVLYIPFDSQRTTADNVTSRLYTADLIEGAHVR